MATSLAPRKAAREAGLVRIIPAVPRSFSQATEPMASSKAQMMPNSDRFLRIWPPAPMRLGPGTWIVKPPLWLPIASISSFM